MLREGCVLEVLGIASGCAETAAETISGICRVMRGKPLRDSQRDAIWQQIHLLRILNESAALKNLKEVASIEPVMIADACSFLGKLYESHPETIERVEPKSAQTTLTVCRSLLSAALGLIGDVSRSS